MKQKRLLLREDVKVKKLSVIKVKFHKFDVCRKFLSPIKLEKNDIVIVPNNDKGSNSMLQFAFVQEIIDDIKLEDLNNLSLIVGKIEFPESYDDYYITCVSLCYNLDNMYKKLCHSLNDLNKIDLFTSDCLLENYMLNNKIFNFRLERNSFYTEGKIKLTLINFTDSSYYLSTEQFVVYEEHYNFLHYNVWRNSDIVVKLKKSNSNKQYYNNIVFGEDGNFYTLKQIQSKDETKDYQKIINAKRLESYSEPLLKFFEFGNDNYDLLCSDNNKQYYLSIFDVFSKMLKEDLNIFEAKRDNDENKQYEFIVTSDDNYSKDKEYHFVMSVNYKNRERKFYIRRKTKLPKVYFILKTLEESARYEKDRPYICSFSREEVETKNIKRHTIVRDRYYNVCVIDNEIDPFYIEFMLDVDKSVIPYFADGDEDPMEEYVI